MNRRKPNCMLFFLACNQLWFFTTTFSSGSYFCGSYFFIFEKNRGGVGSAPLGSLPWIRHWHVTALQPFCCSSMYYLTVATLECHTSKVHERNWPLLKSLTSDGVCFQAPQIPAVQVPPAMKYWTTVAVPAEVHQVVHQPETVFWLPVQYNN